jgi:hypothetical protein
MPGGVERSVGLEAPLSQIVEYHHLGVPRVLVQLRPYIELDQIVSSRTDFAAIAGLEDRSCRPGSSGPHHESTCPSLPGSVMITVCGSTIACPAA